MLPDSTQSTAVVRVPKRVFGKIRSAITYLAISEVMHFFEDMGIDIMEVSMIGVILFIITGAFLHVKKRGSNVEPNKTSLLTSVYDVQFHVLQSIHRLSLMLSAQALALWVQPKEFDTDSPLSISQTTWVVMWIVGMIAVLSLLPTTFTSSKEGASFQDVLLYTFTNGIERQFYKLSLDPFILFSLALVLLYYVQKSWSGRNTFLNMVHEAVCMVLANVCIVGFVQEAQSTHVYANVLKLGQLVCGVIIVGYLAENIKVAASVQTLILWRASREVWVMVYNFTTDDFTIFFSLLLLYMVLRNVQKYLAVTILLVVSKHVVNVSLREIQHLPQVSAMVASYILLLGADILTEHF
jgi:hypothetical protein